MWWEGIRVRDRLAVQHDSVLFFQAVWSKIQRACQRKMGKREKRGRKRGRRKDGETGEEVRRELYKAAVSFMFICAVVSDADCVASALLKSDMKSSKMLFIKWPFCLEWSVSTLGHVGGLEKFNHQHTAFQPVDTTCFMHQTWWQSHMRTQTSNPVYVNES